LKIDEAQSAQVPFWQDECRNANQLALSPLNRPGPSL